MTKFGSNMKMTVASTLRDVTRVAFETGLGCSRMSPNDSIDLFEFADGGRIGVDYVAPEGALTPEQQKVMGTWIEFEVADEEESAKKFTACEGVTAFSFVTSHRYFQFPGGQVIRFKR